MNRYMVFDVESIGLHGEGFAVGWVIVNEEGKELASAMEACPPNTAQGDDENRRWVGANCPTLYARNTTPYSVRDRFWREWLLERARGAVLVADCPWPVEANFLSKCMTENPASWDKGPYPLLDVASVRLAAGLDPLAVAQRLPNELPVHDPVADARQSARLFIEALTLCKKARKDMEW